MPKKKTGPYPPSRLVASNRGNPTRPCCAACLAWLTIEAPGARMLLLAHIRKAGRALSNLGKADRHLWGLRQRCECQGMGVRLARVVRR